MSPRRDLAKAQKAQWHLSTIDQTDHVMVANASGSADKLQILLAFYKTSSRQSGPSHRREQEMVQ